MRNRLEKFSWLATGLLTLTTIGFDSNLIASAQSASKNQYPQSFVNEYMTTCLQRAASEGIEEQDRRALCNCTLNKFQSKYTLEQFKNLSQTVREDIGYQCLNEILYEE